MTPPRLKIARASLLAALILTVSAAPALAQDGARRSPPERQFLNDLAYALGEAHALHRLCAGPSDTTWYGRMRQLETAEAPDPDFRRRLVQSFNAGYLAGQNEFPACSRASRDAEAAAAAHGAAAARALARVRASQ